MSRQTRAHRASSQRAQRGIVLLDALIAIVIFSIGILGLVALQGQAVKLTGDGKYRTDAAMYADQIIAQMWTAAPSTLAANYQTGGAAYRTWAAQLSGQTSEPDQPYLPGAALNPPTIQIATKTVGTGIDNVVTVTVNWQAPNDVDAQNINAKNVTGINPVVHHYVAVTEIMQ